METPTYKYQDNVLSPNTEAVLNTDESPMLAPSSSSRRRKVMFVITFGLVIVAAVAVALTWHFTTTKPKEQTTALETTTIPTMATPAPTRERYLIGRIQDGSTWAQDEDNNPLNYATQNCYLPQYQSKQGQIFVIGKDNVEKPISIKGINWFGMETSKNIPFGLWTNQQNGTTLYEISAFLSRNKFNSVRLPLNVKSLLNNTPPSFDMVHQQANAALDLTSYITAIGGIVKGLGSRGISVLLDLHNLNSTEKGDAWFGASISADEFLQSVDILTHNFCNDTYWNIIGLDMKNEPYGTTWGDNGPKDFQTGAETIANRMLAGCSNWLAFVEGNAAKHNITVADQTSYFFDWWGGGLREAGNKPLKLSKANKVVYSPHYYSPSVYPQSYLVKGGKRDGDVITGYTEYDDATLSKIIAQSSDEMFGYLRKVQDGALVLGEFGGLFTLDAHENKTTQRVTQNVIAMLKEPGYAGGYMWSLNPESGYEYNPSSVMGYWTEGLLEKDWVHVNTQYLNALKAMDQMAHVVPFPCLKT
ncbi:cell 5A endo-1,4-betaglucanase [Thraustotheca clavata]|uniref:Cell 5A endo-1,4-betaglucanase n=1 Tax=Thraustotheca clavata TaxID=74557 RepID=A0A1V9Z6I6_9STRA|nr:cell 5A endo-1,4-betaglucanase [Thraustotheca clavata]